jgi:4-diphosphocytidyl-2-C-methyl-D-erythritol kinase
MTKSKQLPEKLLPSSGSGIDNNIYKLPEKKILIRSGSKINLYLNVKKELRPDKYHEITSIMQSISLYDELEISVKPLQEAANVKKSSGMNNITIKCNNEDIPLNEKNLVHKAAQLLLKKFKLENSFEVAIKIKKSIPVGSGLAGGSSNAAATLIALNRLLNLGLSYDEMVCLGNEVGSDVPFCISGGTALVEGKGEKITKLADIPFYWIVISINGKKFSSGDVYEKFDAYGKSGKTSHLALLKNLEDCNYKKFFSGISNDLENVVASEDSMVTTLKNSSIELGAMTAQMTGSGPAVFALCEDLITARKVMQGIKKISNKVFLTHTTTTCHDFLN